MGTARPWAPVGEDSASFCRRPKSRGLDGITADLREGSLGSLNSKISTGSPSACAARERSRSADANHEWGSLRFMPDQCNIEWKAHRRSL